MNELPITLSFEISDEFARARFEMLPWVAPDYNDCYQQFGFAPDTLFEETSFDPFACRPTPPQPGGPVPQNYLTHTIPPIDWAGPGSTSTSGYKAQSPHGLVSHHRTTPSSVTPALTQKSSQAINFPPRPSSKRSVTDPIQPSKRDCSQVSVQTKPEKGKGSSKSRSAKPSKTSTKFKASSSTTSSSTSPSVSRTQFNKNQLRTAFRKPKAGNSPTNDGPKDEDLTTEERRARQGHNLVEKQYRNRLNHQFESLLAVLPLERHRHSLADGNTRGNNNSMMTKDRIGVDDDDRRLSKAEVLDMARQRIESLEQECLMLQNERLELMDNMNPVRYAVAQQGTGAGVAYDGIWTSR